jgi:hypothetical protein
MTASSCVWAVRPAGQLVEDRRLPTDPAHDKMNDLDDAQGRDPSDDDGDQRHDHIGQLVEHG